MKILIIKNDGFGDFVLIKDLINNIVNNQNFTIDIAITKNNEILLKDIHKINKIFKFDSLCHEFNNKKKISYNDQLELKKIGNQSYDKCLVLRKFLNQEQIYIMNYVISKERYTCFKVINIKNIKLKENWENIKIPENLLHDFEYFKFFLKNLNLLDIKNYECNEKKFINNDRLVINLSGEKNLKKLKNIKFFLETVFNFYKNEIIIIGKCFDEDTNLNIKKFLKNISDQRIKNLWDETDFKSSLNFIEKSKIYIGFDTGLSHYAASLGIKSLILLSLGSGFRFWPYPSTIKSNISYIFYNTPCSGCNFEGSINKCFFKYKYCVENILDNKDLFKKYLNIFFNTNTKYFKNFSDRNYLINDWNYYKAKKSKVITFDEKKNISIVKKKFKVFTKILSEWIKFSFKNNLYTFNLLKIFLKNLISFFYSK